MNTRKQLSHAILRQAAHWFGKFRAVELPSGVPVSERRDFYRWLRESPQNVEAYLEVALTYADIVAPRTCKYLPARAAPCAVRST